MTNPMISTSLARVLKDAPLTANDGIVSYLDRVETGQAREQGDRDAVMERHRNRSVEEIMREVARHHGLTVMSEQAREFRGRFSEDEWIIDIGGGTGWYWRGTRGANVLLADFSRETLRVAARLLKPEDRVHLMHCDASRLPILTGALSGVWSVQVFQHFPEPVLAGVLQELRRVLLPDFGAKVFNLNPALLLRAAYRLMGRRYHRRGEWNGLLLNCLTAEDWRARLAPWLVNEDAGRISVRYSELFFHPPLRLKPRRYPLKLEQVLARVPELARLFARQVSIEVERRSGAGGSRP